MYMYMYVLISTDSRQAPLHIIYQAHWNWLGRSGHGLTKSILLVCSSNVIACFGMSSLAETIKSQTLIHTLYYRRIQIWLVGGPEGKAQRSHKGPRDRADLRH